MTLIKTSTDDAVLTLTLDRPPAHAISRELVSELAERLDQIESEPPGALVITGAGDRFFSAGLDLLELYPLERAELAKFAPRFLETMLRVWRLPIPVVAAVNGHAIAGGAILALATDHRTMARGRHVFGLNEIQVGLALPSGLLEMVRASVQPAWRARVILEGRNLPTDDALAAGLVEELVEPDELRARAHERASELAKIPAPVYARMKARYRAPAERAIQGSDDGQSFLENWFEPDTRRVMGAIYERLRSRSGSRA
jgi:enoyl-CoA hydratase/carnithine racemase